MRVRTLISIPLVAIFAGALAFGQAALNSPLGLASPPQLPAVVAASDAQAEAALAQALNAAGGSELLAALQDFTTSGGGLCAGDPKQVCQRTDARGITTTYSYDAENRLTSKTYSDSTPAAYYYYDESSVSVAGTNYTVNDGKGRLTHTTADGGNAITIHNYSAAGNLLDLYRCTPYNCSSGTLWDMKYYYYPGGEESGLEHPAGYTLTEDYGRDGRTSGIYNNTFWPTTIGVFAYAPQGSLATFENGATHQYAETYNYNNRLQLVRLQLAPSSPPNDLACWVYNYYGNVANPTTCAVPSQGTGEDGDVIGQYYDHTVNTSMTNTTALAYDPTHRLTSAAATSSSTYNLTFGYDRYGNMTCQTNAQTQGPCPNYSFNASTNQR